MSLAVLRRRRRLEADNRARIEKNVVAARNAVAGRDGFSLYAPQAGSVALLDLGVADASPICEQLLAETGSMLVAASFFEDGGDRRLRGCVRLGLGRASFAADFSAVVDRLHALARA